MVKFYKYGKDEEILPCIELDDGTIITHPEITLALIKVLKKKGYITFAELKGELPTVKKVSLASRIKGGFSKIATYIRKKVFM